jgi:hypothetical protein
MTARERGSAEDAVGGLLGLNTWVLIAVLAAIMLGGPSQACSPAGR